MIKRGNLVVILMFLMFFIFIIPSTSANFVCGIVNNSESISTSWFNVKIYYTSNPSNYTVCKVSPDENKYCCDPENIKGASWAIGKEINASIEENGYIANPVSLTITGAGYDLFPSLELKKIININEPSSSLYFNDTFIKINVSVADEYNNIKYLLRDENFTNIREDDICFNCTESVVYIENVSFGQYNLEIIAFNSNRNFSENKSFSILEYLYIKRDIDCDEGCKKLAVHSISDNVTVRIIVNASHRISGILSDIFPNDWIYEGNSSIDEFTETHNKISWSISGKNIVEEYLLKPPKNIITSRYVFQSSFDSYEDAQDNIILYRLPFLKFFEVPKFYSKGKIPKDNVIISSEVDQSKPIVIKPKRGNLIELAIFPKNYSKNVLTFIKNSVNIKINNAYNFLIWTSLDKENIDNVMLKFKVKKLRTQENVSLFYYQQSNATWDLIDSQKYHEDENYSYYQTIVNYTGFFSIKNGA